MGDRNGAIIAMDPHTGAVLALVSRPAFDPNDFSVRVSRGEWNKLITDPRHPLLDKAIQAQLAPGSTFKIIMSLAGLENDVAQKLRVVCNGGATFYGRFFACDKRHGPVDILHAIPKSCDTFYYTLAERLGIEKIAYWAHKVGIGQKTGIDLPGEVSGTMPSEEWKMKNFHEKWYAGEVISVGIGQGAVAIAPIQLVRAIAGIASGGVVQAAARGRARSVTGGIPPGDLSNRIPGRGRDFPDRSRDLGDDHRRNGGALDANHCAGCTAFGGAPGKHRLRGQNGHGAGGEPQRRYEEPWCRR